MSDFFDKLGDAARRTADKVSNQVSITAQEQKVKVAYQELGKLCYTRLNQGKNPTGAEIDKAVAQVTLELEELARLRERKTVEPGQ